MIKCVLGRVLFVGLSVAALAAPAWSGVVIELEGKGASAGEKMRVVLYVEPGRLRAETQSAEGESILIFRADRQLVWVIQPAQKSYTEMTEADMARVAGQMQAMLKDLPPDQRAMMEQMMKRQSGAGKAPQISVKRVGAEAVGKFDATKYEVWSDGGRVADVWAAPLAQVNVQPAEHETFLQFTRFMEKLTQAVGSAGSSGDWTRHAAAIEGFPVKSVSYESTGKPANEQQVVRAERQAVGDDKFQVPPGMRKMQMGEPEP